MTFRASPLPHPLLALLQQGEPGSLTGEDVGAIDLQLTPELPLSLICLLHALCRYSWH